MLFRDGPKIDLISNVVTILDARGLASR
jgi:hypothetical protein